MRLEEGSRDNGAPDSSMVVAVRVRPLSSKEINNGQRSCCEVHGQVVTLSKSSQPGHHLRSQQGQVHEFAYDYAFAPEVATQSEVYQKTARPLIPYLLEGFNATVFAYGATGAGKTHTMMGSERDGDNTRSKCLEHGSGIIPQSLYEIFELIEQKKASEGDRVGLSGPTWKVIVSYLEVYNEQIYDLLNPSTRTLQIREDAAQGVVHVAGLAEVEANNAGEVMDLLRKGNQHRKTEPTAANQVSSRSHAVLQVTVKYSAVSGARRVSKEGKLSLIDLAGSERASKTQNRGIRLHEGANINKSLLALANCINALAANSGCTSTTSHYGVLDSFATPARTRKKKCIRVQYRDSKLTHLLKSSLEGNCRLVMIANVSASNCSFEESLNTLKYANRAKNIKVVPQATVMTAELSNLQRMTRLESENASLKEQIASLLAMVKTNTGGQREASTTRVMFTPEPRKRNSASATPGEELSNLDEMKDLRIASTAKRSARKRRAPSPEGDQQSELDGNRALLASAQKRPRRTPRRSTIAAQRPDPDSTDAIPLTEKLTQHEAEEDTADMKERLKELQDGRRVMMALIDSLQAQLAETEEGRRIAERKLADLQSTRLASIQAAVDDAVSEVEDRKDREIRKLTKLIQTLREPSNDSVGNGMKELPGMSSSSLQLPTPSYKLRLRARESIGSAFMKTPSRTPNPLQNLGCDRLGGTLKSPGDNPVRRSKRRASLIPRLPSFNSSSSLRGNQENQAMNTMYSKSSYGIKTRSMTAVTESSEEPEEDDDVALQHRRRLGEITNRTAAMNA